MTQTITITTSYDEWQSVPRGGGKALCQAPSVAGVHARIGKPLTFDRSAKAWTGSVEAALALADALDKQAAVWEGDGEPRGITDRLNRKQAARMRRVSKSIREQVGS